MGKKGGYKLPAVPAAAPVARLAPIVARHRMIIAVDFGTTYSGVAYVTSDKKSIDDIQIITTWPNHLSVAHKVPTRIAYALENSSRTFGDSNKWGFEVEPRHTSYSWIKLLLDRNATAGQYDDPSLANLSVGGMLQLPAHRTAPEVCEDFLRGVYEYVSMKLKRQIGETTFDITPMEVWITLPAIWSDLAKEATRRAAKNAGFGSRASDEIFTIAEPEAAAIATLKKYSEETVVNAVKRNEHILICDCGGGTVDITTYTIRKVTPHLEFDELCVGVGGKCGATYIDRNLHTLMSQRFGEAFDDVALSQKSPGSRFMREFEKVKRSFGANNDRSVRAIEPLTLDVKDSDYYDSDDRAVLLSYSDMQSLFDPVVNQILNLVKQQVHEVRVKKNASIDRIILVGGFGDSAYLNQKLTEWCKANGNIELLCPDLPQAAVVRGAALRGLEGLAPRMKQARRHYGYSCSRLFREGIDPEEDSYVSRFNGRKYCSGLMHWMIAKGEPIFRDTNRTSSLAGEVTPGRAYTDSINLFCCALDEAPGRVDDPGVEVVGDMYVRFPADFDYGDSMKSSWNYQLQKNIHEADYNIEVVFGNQGDNLTIRTLINGQVQGTASIEYASSS